MTTKRNDALRSPTKSHDTQTDTKIDGKLKKIANKIQSFHKKITVEPFIVCYILPSVLAGLAVQNLCLEKACVVDLNYDNVTCDHIMAGDTAHYAEQEQNVQILVTKMTAWSYPLQSAVPGFLVLFIGAWSDRTGNRRFFMVLPIMGKLLATLGVLLSVYFFSDVGLNETALMEGLPPAITGGRVAMTLAVYSYMTDITSSVNRTTRIGIVTAVITLSRPLGLALTGITTRTLGYYGVFSISLSLYLIGFVYIMLRIKNCKKKELDVSEGLPEKEKSKSVAFFSADSLVSSVRVAFRKREGTRRLRIFLIMSAYMLVVGPVLGEAQMTYWFARYKFKFTEVDYSFFLTYSVLVNFVGSFVTIYLLSKRWKVDDGIIGMIACVSRIAGSVLYAVAPTKTSFFMAPMLDMFSSSGATALRSIITKLVDPDEIGKAGSLVGISEALVPVIYSPIYSKVYLQSLKTFPGSFYLISASLALPGILIFIILFVLGRTTGGKEENINKKEAEITKF